MSFEVDLDSAVLESDYYENGATTKTERSSSDFKPNTEPTGTPTNFSVDLESAELDEKANQGFIGTLVDGAKSAGRAINSTYNTYTGDAQAVIDNAKTQELANEDKSQDIKNFQSDWAANTGAGTDDEVGLWGAIKGTGKAIIDNPRGAALSVVEQFPNSFPTLAAGWAGAKTGFAVTPPALPIVGPAAKPIGGIIGGIAGLFAGNTAIETGHKAQEYAADGEFTSDEQSAAMTEGAKKAGVITAVDALTFGIAGKVPSTMRRTTESAVEAATRKTLIDAGVDISDTAALAAARSNPQIASQVVETQKNAARIADSLRKRAAEAGVLLTLETIGEGLGEYLGELAATGQASVSEAVLESFLSLGQSGVQTMFNLAKARDRSLTDQEWVDAANGIAPEGIAPEQLPVADGIWDEPAPEAKIDMGQMQDGGVTPTPVFNPQDIDRNLAPTPSQQMGINPDAGPLSAAAAQSVDSGLFTGGFTPQAGINQTALEREGVTPPPVLDADQIDRNLGSIDPITGEYMPAPELLDQPNQAVNTGNYEYDRYGNLSKVDGRTVEGYGQNQPRLGFNNKAERSTAPLYEVGPDGVARPSSGEAARSRKERIDLSTLEGRQQTQAQKQPAAMPEQRSPEQQAQSIWDSMNAFERNKAAVDTLGHRGVLAKNTATKAWDKLSAEQQAKLVSGLDAQQGQRWTDPNQKVTDQTGPVLQNRDRTSQDSINQMRSISNNPDYSRLKTSGFLSDGAPVVVDENIQIPVSQVGVTDTASAGSERFNVQYAVVEADQLMTSNSIDGTTNAEYQTGAAGKARAIAGNGRITGLQSAWAKGNANQYKADMAADRMHGIDPAVIEGMRNPILVRLLPQDQVTDNIGDLSNRDEKGRLSPVEQAKTDMGRIDLDSLKFTADGAIGGEAIHQFRMAQPAAERVSEAEARKRLTSAIFQKAYGNDQLTEIQSGESDDAKSILSALAQAAPSMSRLEGAGEFDIRPLITQAGIAAVNAARRGTKLADYVQQSEMGIDPMVYPILEMMLNEHGNIRSSKYIGEQLTNMAKLAYDEANSPSSDMFGEKPKRTAEQVIQDALTGVQGYGQINDGRGQESLGQRGRSEPDAQMVEGPEGGRERPADTRQTAPTQPEAEQEQPAAVESNAPETWRSNYIQSAKIAREKGIDPKQHKKLADLVAAIDAIQDAEATPEIKLTQQTEESLAKDAERLERLQKEEATQKAAQKAAESKQRERDADKARADEVVDDFQLGQSTEEVMSGMGDIFATESKPADKGIAAQDNDSQVTVVDDQYNPNPTEAQKQAGNYKKAHVKFQGIDITIENPVGSERSGVDLDGNAWSNTIKHDYGYIKRTTGADGDHVDVFIGKDTDSDKVFVIDQPHKNGKFDEHKVMLGFKGRAQAVAAYKGNYQKGWKVGPITEMTVGEFKQWLSNGDTTKPVETVAKPAAEQAKPNQAVEDYGEKMAGAIKDQPINSLSKNLTDEEMASQPLSALWPVNEPLSIEDNYAAAFSYAARQNIPAKPRLKYKVKRWVDAVKSMREIAKAVQDGEITKDNIGALSKINDTASSLAAKANLLSGLDRKHWSRIGRVDVSDNAYIFDDNRNKVPSPHTTVMVDGRGVLVKGKYDNDSVTAVIKASLEMAEQSDASKRGQFEIREIRKTGEIFINRKGDKEYRKLKTFPKGSLKEARDFVNNNTDELVAEWEAIKERDNVTKADVRSDTNKERTGIDYRNGKDVTSEEFGETFGFRGVEFGNWVSQGKGQKDRQGMLNAAYDALLDLAAVVGIPPKAVSLNGSLGIAFGSRGKGKASAHYETNNIVINLTKTKGAGSLAHEWFHALDNYFSRRRGVTPFDGNNTAYNKANYITYKPEPMMALKSSLNKKGLRPHLITKAEYDRRAKNGVNFDADNWTPDTNHPIGVRPTVEKAFADLVNELDKSPMLERAKKIDKGKVDGYWSSIIERAARSFESYVIQRLEDQGISNQYLANVVTLENFKRDEGRYPYLTPEELKPVAEKFDTLFNTIETREEKDGNFLMFSRHNNQPNNPTTNASLLKNINDSYPALTDSVVTMLQRGRKGQKGGLVIVDSNNGADIAKAYSEATGLPIAQANRLFSDGESINGFYDTKSGITFLVGPNLDATTAPAVLLHEVTHSQQRSEIDARSMKLINGRAKEKNADLKTFLETVSQRMIDAGEYGNPLESTAYIVEQAIIEGRSQGYTLADSKFFNAIEKTLGATVASIVRDFTKMVRQFALRRGLPINITLDDLVQYAMASVEQAAKGNIATENKGGMAYSFAGEDALTADLASLAEAKKQIATDLTPEQVRKNTGWMQGAEGRWRFEIDDSKASFVDAPMLDSYLSDTLTGEKKLNAADQKALNLLKLKERKMSAEVFGAKDKKTDAWDHLFYEWHQVKQQIQELDRRAGGDFMNVGSILNHDQLFNAYPNMKNIKIRLAVDDSVTMNGFYDRKDNLIEMTAPNKEKLMDGLLHELQHAIQSIEGFARGGSPSQFDYKDATSEYLGRVSNKIIDLLNSNKEFGAAVRKVKQEFTKLSNKYPRTTKDGQESVNWDKVPADESEAYFKLLDETEKHPEAERWHDLETEYRIALRDGKTLTPFEQYQSLAGEVEARNVESRRHFTEEERREFSPIASEDFQRQDQTIRYSRSANPASISAAPNGMAAWDSPSASKFDDFVYKMQDKHVDTKRVIEAIRDTGKAISDDLDVYLQETLFHGRAAKRTQDFLNKEVNPLIEYMQSAKVDMSDLEEFLHARHAQEANALIAKRDPNMPDGGSGMTNAEAAKYLNSLNGVRRKQLENAAKFVDKIIGGTRETIVNYGLESQETVDGWTAGFKHYIPLQREDKDGQMGIGQGFSVKGKETKGRTGSTRKVVDILANVMMQRERAIVRGEKNRVAVALLGLAKDNPLPEFWQVDKVPTTRVLDKVTGLVRNQADPMYKSRDNAIVAKVNGQEHAILMNEDDPRAMRMAEALKNLDAAQLEGLLGATATATRYFAAVNTQYNPIFGVTNFVRDIQEAMLHLESTPLKGKQKEVFKTTFLAVPAVWRAERASRRGESSKDELGILWDDFQNVGGQTGFRDQFSNSADRSKEIQRALTPDGWAETGLGKFFTANGALKAPLEVVRKKAAWMFDILSDYNTAMENGVRLAVYKAGIDAGLSKQQSAATAKGITVNFNRKGQATQQIGALYAFFNASVQGSARLGQSLFDMEPGKPKTMRLSKLGQRIVSGGVLLGASQAVLLAMAGFDDEEPPEFIRERNIIIPNPLSEKGYFSIPMPLGYHVIANLGRIPTEFALGGGKDGAKHLISLLDIMSDVYNPLGSSGLSMQTIAPTVLDPLAALAENKDFSGRAIAKESFNRQTPGHALARDTASLPATWLAQVINYATGGTEFTRGEFSPTPDQIDYLVGQLTGGVGREVTKFLKTGQAASSGDDLQWHNVPLLGRFYGDADSDGAKQSAFYNNMDKVRKHAEEVKGLRAAGRSSEAIEYANKHPQAKLHLAARAAEKQVKDMRDRKRDLEQAGAPREEIRALEKRMVERMEQFVELAKAQ